MLLGWTRSAALFTELSRPLLRTRYGMISLAGNNILALLQFRSLFRSPYRSEIIPRALNDAMSRPPSSKGDYPYPYFFLKNDIMFVAFFFFFLPPPPVGEVRFFALGGAPPTQYSSSTVYLISLRRVTK